MSPVDSIAQTLQRISSHEISMMEARGMAQTLIGDISLAVLEQLRRQPSVQKPKPR
jgi:hypothetical protein